MVRNNKHKGDISEAKAIVKLMELGYRVSRPISEDCRYDLIIDDENILSRIQVKTARMVSKDSMEIRLYSTNGNDAPKKKYKNECEYIAAYCFETDEVYFIPAKYLDQLTVTLRLKEPKTYKGKNIHYTRDFLYLN